MTKNGGLMFVGRENELKILNRVFSSNRQESVLIYGRRRIGKTELIKKAIEDFDGEYIYYESKQTTELSNVDSLSSLISDMLNLPRLGFQSMEEVFEFLFSYTKDKTMVFVLDEYPYLRSCMKGLDSILQTVIDKHLHTSHLKLILCGSYVDTMKSLIERENPLYGRFTRILDIKPMDYYDSSLFYPSFSNEDKVALYSVFGGIPYYNRLIDESLSVRENIIDLIASQNGLLLNEVPMYLKNEISKINNANEVFETLAAGNTKFMNILNKSHIASSPILSDVLDKLMKMGVVEKRAPINDKNNKKKAGYYICDNFTLFYYKYIYKYISQLNVMNEDAFFDRFIKDDLYKSHIPTVFEWMCQQFLIRKNKLNELEVPFFEIGKYYYDDPVNKMNGEFDVVTQDDNGYIFYECKYKNSRVTQDVVDQEIEQVKNVNMSCYKYGFFSKTGFDLTEDSNIILYTLDDLYHSFSENI